MTEDLLERIRRLCERLVEIAPWWSGWWTPAPDQRLAAFEREHGIVLPDGYRSLLTTIGERAPIPGRPHGGLLELDQALAVPLAAELLGALDQPFIGAGDDPIELEWDDEADAYTDPTPLAGCLPVLDRGDAIDVLVVTGADRGRVWSFAPSSAPALRPAGAEFLDWYLVELERGMIPLEKEAQELEAHSLRVERNSGDLAACVALGRRLLLSDRDRARDLLEGAWAVIESLDADTQIELRRAIAELDLLDGRRDRIEAMADSDDPWLHTYAGIAAAHAGAHEQVIARLEALAIPVLLRSAAIGHLALAHAACGRIEHAIGLLRATQASASNHAIAARLREATGQREAALRSWKEALATQDRSRTGPRPPRLTDFIEAPVPSPAAIAGRIAALK
jgi:hypothetical protein